jgi:hypothetical protein
MPGAHRPHAIFERYYLEQQGEQTADAKCCASAHLWPELFQLLAAIRRGRGFVQSHCSGTAPAASSPQRRNGGRIADRQLC